MNNTPYLLFDLDGTLVDSLPDLTLSLNLLREELKLAPLQHQQVHSMVGDGASVLVKKALGDDLYEKQHLTRFMEIYDQHLLDNTLCYPGIKDLLTSHPADKMAVVTNKPYALTIKLLEGLKIKDSFKAIIGGDSLDHKKPHPLPVQTALAQLNAKPEQAVMIGDHHTDINSGRSAGTAVCFCDYGIGHSDNLEYDFYAQQASDLLTLFPGL
jgi:phosphoglycolate phosphatase